MQQTASRIHTCMHAATAYTLKVQVSHNTLQPCKKAQLLQRQQDCENHDSNTDTEFMHDCTVPELGCCCAKQHNASNDLPVLLVSLSLVPCTTALKCCTAG